MGKENIELEEIKDALVVYADAKKPRFKRHENPQWWVF